MGDLATTPRLGVFPDLSQEDYRADSAIANSDLSQLQISPQHFKEYKARKNKKPTESQIFGTLVHAAILEPHTFPSLHVIKPEGMTFQSKENKAWRDAQWAAGKMIVSIEDSQNIMGCVQSFMANPFLKELWHTSQKEVSVFAVCKRTGLRIKCRPDLLTETGDTLADLKTTGRGNAQAEPWFYEVKKWRYYRQASWYMYVMKCAGYDREVFVSVPLESEAPWATKPWNMPQEMIALGFKEIFALVDQFKECMDKDEWPGYPTMEPSGVDVLPIPEGYRRRLEGA